jgi:hypothetical protein
VANWFGAPFSVVSGGVGCLLATAWVAASTPALRHYARGHAAHHAPGHAAHHARGHAAHKN